MSQISTRLVLDTSQGAQQLQALQQQFNTSMGDMDKELNSTGKAFTNLSDKAEKMMKAARDSIKDTGAEMMRFSQLTQTYQWYGCKYFPDERRDEPDSHNS